MTKLKIEHPPFPNREAHPFVATINYKGLVIDVENLDGSIRSGEDANGKPWYTRFDGAHYGEIRGSAGTDGDPLDVYLVSAPKDSDKVYVVHQNFPGNHPSKAGQFDEDKVVLGADSLEEAKKLYLKHYSREDFLRSITEMSFADFRKYIFGESKGEKLAAPFLRMKLREGGIPTVDWKEVLKKVRQKKVKGAWRD